MHTVTEENYLKAIYRLSQDTGVKITPTTIADAVGVQAATVVDMLRKLTKKKLISYNKTKGARLTATGHETALGIVRLHRLWEVFLSEKLGYSWDVVHEIAEQLEHVKHAELAARLDRFLGSPEYDPHGDPIPDAQGAMPVTATTLLSEIAPGKTCRVAAVRDTSPAFLQYLERLSIRIGTHLKVLERIAFDGSMSLQIGKDKTATVSQKFSESLLVN